MAARSTAVTPMLKGACSTRCSCPAPSACCGPRPSPPATDTVRNGHRPGLRMTFENIGLMACRPVLELAYNRQQTRWDKDWPTLLALLNGRQRAVVLWFVDHGLHVVGHRRIVSRSWLVRHPCRTTWLAMVAVPPGPVRVLHIVALRGAGSSSRRRTAAAPRRRLDTRWFESLRAPRRRGPPTRHRGGRRGRRRGHPARRDTGPRSRGMLCPNATSATPTPGMRRVWTATRRNPVSGAGPPVVVLVLADGSTQVLSEDLG